MRIAGPAKVPGFACQWPVEDRDNPEDRTITGWVACFDGTLMGVAEASQPVLEPSFGRQTENRKQMTENRRQMTEKKKEKEKEKKVKVRGAKAYTANTFLFFFANKTCSAPPPPPQYFVIILTMCLYLIYYP